MHPSLTPFKGWVVENFPFIEEDIEAIFKVFGDDYYINKYTGEWELCKRNSFCMNLKRGSYG